MQTSKKIRQPDLCICNLNNDRIRFLTKSSSLPLISSCASPQQKILNFSWFFSLKLLDFFVCVRQNIQRRGEKFSGPWRSRRSAEALTIMQVRKRQVTHINLVHFNANILISEWSAVKVTNINFPFLTNAIVCVEDNSF